MNFTERFITLPILIFREGGREYYATYKIHPEYILGYGPMEAEDGGKILGVDCSGVGRLYVRLSIDEFEKLMDDFVGDPVTLAEKHLAVVSRVADKLEENRE